ncbi:MAG: hypothetical protein ACYCWK_10285 [Cuniculiplasma sp.]
MSRIGSMTGKNVKSVGNEEKNQGMSATIRPVGNSSYFWQQTKQLFEALYSSALSVDRQLTS